jgi:hypothetical protein
MRPMEWYTESPNMDSFLYHRIDIIRTTVYETETRKIYFFRTETVFLKSRRPPVRFERRRVVKQPRRQIYVQIMCIEVYTYSL